MISFISQIFYKLQNALRGFKLVLRDELSFRLEIIIGLPIVLLFGYLYWPLERFEFMGLAITYGIVLILELVNSSIEKLLEKLHPEENELIGHSKDIAAAAVLGAIGLLLVVMSLIAFDHM